MESDLIKNPFQDIYTNLRKNEKMNQAVPYKGSKAKYTGEDVAHLLDLIVERQRDIKYNPNLTYSQGAQNFITKRGLATKGWSTLSGDYDNDPNTPDNVLILDKGKVPRYIDGYSIGTGERKRADAILIPRREEIKAQPEQLKKLYKRYLKSPEGKASNYQDFNGWAQTHPIVESNYAKLQKYFSQRLSKTLTNVGLDKTKVNFIPLLSEVVRSVIGLYKSQNPNTAKKLTVQDYEKIASYPLESNSNLNTIIAKHLKNRRASVPLATDPFGEAPLTYREFSGGSPTVNVKAQSRQPRTATFPENPSFIPPTSTSGPDTSLEGVEDLFQE
jgi:hypothetical protein